MPPRSQFATPGRFDLLSNDDEFAQHTESEDETPVAKIEEKSEASSSGKKKKKSSKNKKRGVTSESSSNTTPIITPNEHVQEEVEAANAHGGSLLSESIAATHLAPPISDSSSQQNGGAPALQNPSISSREHQVQDTASGPATPTPQPKKGKKSKAASKDLPSTPFSPELPPTLPVPSSPPAQPRTPEKEVFNSNHKRPAPSDFSLDAKGILTPPAKGVKFQDGLSPGQGRDGETVIPGVGRHALEKLKSVEGKLEEKAKAVISANAPKAKSNVFERTIWTFLMIFGFISLLLFGPPYMILLVLLCQCLVYKEITNLFDLSVQSEGGESNSESGDQWSKTLNWYFFVVSNYFLYGESIIYYFKHIVFVDAYFIPFARNHRFISFMLYVIGFMAFVMNLQKQYLRRQFGLFCWVHMTLLLIVVSSHFIVNNILEGLIWFFVPASIVICNDIFAYICGKTFGKTPLFTLSPKKTVEGFVGAFFCTLVFAVAWGTLFMQFPYMICPAQDLGVSAWSDVKCDPNPAFVWRSFEWPSMIQSLVGHAIPSFSYAPFQIHCLVMGAFASLVAPFGGFFASGFKRAFDIKDFGDSIPGHGGMTDRMDCQFIMGVFAAVYYSSLVRVHHVTVGSVLQVVVNSLTTEEQLKLVADLQTYLHGQGIKVVNGRFA